MTQNGPQRYGVYLARVRFVESDRFKIRPVVTVSSPVGKYGIVSVLPVSSRELTEDGDVALKLWRTAGLIRESTVRIHRVLSIAQGDLQEEIGSLQTDDIASIKSALKKHLDL